MDIQCPAAFACLTPGDQPPESVNEQRVVAAYVFDVPEPAAALTIPVHRFPVEKFWEGLRQIADRHRGEAAVVYASEEFLRVAMLLDTSLVMTSEGPERL